jgi:hypothetical protein
MKHFLTPLLLIGSLSAAATLSYAQGGSAEKPTPTPKPTPRDKKTTRTNEYGEKREMESPRAPKGELTITTNPPGCAVLLNKQAKGTTDGSGLLSLGSLKPGQYILVARKAGYREETRMVNVGVGRSEVVTVTLSPLPGSLAVRAGVAGARIEIPGVGVFTDNATRSLAPGSYQVIVSKPGFRTEERTVEVRPGETATLTVPLSPVTPAEMVTQAERDFGQRRFDAVIAASRGVLSSQPDHARAHQLLGLSLYYTGHFAESVEPLAKAVRLGQEVVLPIKHHHRGANMGLDDALCEGKLTLSRNGLSFNSLNAVGHDFTAPYQKLQEIKPENFKGGRLNIKVSLPEGKGEKRKDYNFHVWQTQLVNTAQPGNRPLMNVNCRDQSCDAAVQMLYQLLMRLKQS